MIRSDSAEICVFFALTPVHAGSGQSLGAVDLPIQRERHTAWPHIQSSGVKGAFRDWFQRYYEASGSNCTDKEIQAGELTQQVFGREEGSGSKDSNDNNSGKTDGNAGAVVITDARLLAFPVRSNVAPFVWVTCPAVLARLNRDINLVSGKKCLPEIISCSSDHYIPIKGEDYGDVVLEDLAVSPENRNNSTEKINDIFTSICSQISDRLLLISDENFSFLVQCATEIQAQIRINQDTGTADDGSLRYQEFLPSDSILYSLIFFSGERTLSDKGLKSDIIKSCVKTSINSHIQIGGDMTTGKGLMEVNWVNLSQREV
jgi:CRISPR-associated protein Cmr4